MHLFPENKKRNDFGNNFFCVWGGGKRGWGGRETGKNADTMNVETAQSQHKLCENTQER